MLLLHALAFAHGGLPLIYMGDELGLRNDPAWARRPARTRRQPLDAPPVDGLGGGRAPARPGPVEGRMWAGPAAARRGAPASPALHAQGRSEPLWTGNDHVFGLLREHAGDRLLVLANVTEDEQRIGVGLATSTASRRGQAMRAARGRGPRPRALRLRLAHELRRPPRALRSRSRRRTGPRSLVAAVAARETLVLELAPGLDAAAERRALPALDVLLASLLQAAFGVCALPDCRWAIAMTHWLNGVPFWPLTCFLLWPWQSLP